MARRKFAPLVMACLLGIALPAAVAAQTATEWDGLAKVKSKRFDAVYLAPGAEFQSYTKVMLDPTEVAFRKNWVRDYNDTVIGLSDRIREKDAQEGLELVRKGFEEASRKGHAAAGYQIVTEPGADVLRVRTAVVNLDVSSPDRQRAGRSRSYASEAGSATVVIELRDSLSGALLARAVDGRIAGDSGPMLRNSITNKSDFQRLFNTWVKIGTDGLAQLKSGAVPAPVARK